MKSILIILISFALISSGASQTRNVVVGTNGTVVQPTNFWSADVTNARSGLGLGTASTNPASAFQPSSSVLTNLASSNAVNLTNLRLSNVVGWPALTNTNAATSLLGFTTNGQVVANTGTNVLTFTNGSIRVGDTLNYLDITAYGLSGIWPSSISLDEATLYGPDEWTIQAGANFGTNGPSTRANLGFSTNLNTLWTATNAAIARTNLNLGWSALTNTNTSEFNTSLYGSNTNPVLVDSNGSVVSPTNFWQRAPIVTIVQNFTPVVNATNAATNSRTLYVYSLAISTAGVTNVITLPTNSSTFNGDNVTVIHNGPTSSVTSVKQLGASTNFVDISSTDAAVKFIYENNAWKFYHNIGFTEPIKFVDGNLELNKAQTRTNLELGFTALTNTNSASFQRAIFSTNSNPASSANLSDVKAWIEVSLVTNNVTNSFRIPAFQ